MRLSGDTFHTTPRSQHPVENTVYTMLAAGSEADVQPPECWHTVQLSPIIWDFELFSKACRRVPDDWARGLIYCAISENQLISNFLAMAYSFLNLI